VNPGRDVFLAAQRGIIFVACLFALFCSSLEVNRLMRSKESQIELSIMAEVF
jgi:hypothetical protein